MTGQPDIEAFVAAFKAEIVKNNDLDKESGSNFVADGGDYLTIDATFWNDDLRVKSDLMPQLGIAERKLFR